VTYDAFTDRVVRPLLLASVALSAVLLPMNIAIGMRDANLDAQTLNAPAPVTNFSDWAINILDRRLSTIESQNLDGRLRVNESDMAELKWLSRSVAVAVIGQFAVAGMAALKRRV